MPSSTIRLLAAGGLIALMLAPISPAFAQSGMTVTPPVSGQATKGQTDAAKQAMDAERRRQEEEAKKAAQKK